MKDDTNRRRRRYRVRSTNEHVGPDIFTAGMDRLAVILFFFVLPIIWVKSFLSNKTARRLAPVAMQYLNQGFRRRCCPFQFEPLETAVFRLSAGQVSFQSRSDDEGARERGSR